MHFVVVAESSAFAGALDGPTGEAARHFDNVLLRIAAVYAERVQFQQLAAVVLVQSSFWLSTTPHRRSVRRNRLPVVQIKQHRRTLGCRFQEIPKLTKRVRADGFTLVGGHHVMVRAL